MCNIAGYVGTSPASPILVDMIRRQKGWDYGHYTGGSTLDKRVADWTSFAPVSPVLTPVAQHPS